MEEAKYLNILSGRFITKKGDVYKKLSKNAIVLQAAIKRKQIMSLGKKNLLHLNIPLRFSREYFEKFYKNAWKYSHIDSNLSFRKIQFDAHINDYDIIDGMLLDVSHYQKHTSLKNNNIEFAFKLGFNTKVNGFVIIYIYCNSGDNILNLLEKACNNIDLNHKIYFENVS